MSAGSFEGVSVGGVQPGFTVYGADGKKIGDIDEVHSTYLKLHKGLIFRKDVFVPLSAVASLRGNEVHLTVSQSAIDGLGWDTAPFATGGRGPGQRATIQRLVYGDDLAPFVDRVFSKEALRIPVRAERVEVAKTPVITGEVAITKAQEIERETVQTTVRKTEVEVERRVEEHPELIVRRDQGVDVASRATNATDAAPRAGTTGGESLADRIERALPGDIDGDRK